MQANCIRMMRALPHSEGPWKHVPLHGKKVTAVRGTKEGLLQCRGVPGGCLESGSVLGVHVPMQSKVLYSDVLSGRAEGSAGARRRGCCGQGGSSPPSLPATAPAGSGQWPRALLWQGNCWAGCVCQCLPCLKVQLHLPLVFHSDGTLYGLLWLLMVPEQVQNSPA